MGAGLDRILTTPGHMVDWIGEAGRHLPTRPGGKGPTQGLLYDTGGQQITATPPTRPDATLRSGAEPTARDGLRPDWHPLAHVTREHVESHAAAYRRRDNTPEEAIIVINKRTCLSRGEYVGCDEVLPGMLPPDKRLAVYVTDGRSTSLWKVYRGTGEGIAP